MSGQAVAEPPYSIAGEAREEFASGEAASEKQLVVNFLSAISNNFLGNKKLQ